MKPRSTCQPFPPKTHEDLTDKAHGRIEQRRIDVLPAEAIGDMMEEWQGLAQIFRITRTRQEKHKRQWKAPAVEIVYGITSLDETTPPENLLKFNRRQWAIENKLHRNKDTLLGEDQYTNRTNHAPRNVNSLLNLTLTILTTIHTSPTQAIEWIQDDRNRAIAMI